MSIEDEKRSDEIGVGSEEVTQEQLTELLDGLVRERGRVGAAEALGVNYRTLAGSADSGKLSRRMREALAEFAKTGIPVRPEDRIEAVEEAMSEVREALESQASRLEELEGRLSQVERDSKGRETRDDADQDEEVADWTPPKRAYGLPDAGVVTLEAQPDEDHAFGPAAGLVTEWRSLMTGGVEVGSRIERARAEERRWKLEVAMIGEFGLTLPPETEPLDDERRDDHLQRRQGALVKAHRERVREQRLRVVRRVVTLGLWWK